MRPLVIAPSIKKVSVHKDTVRDASITNLEVTTQNPTVDTKRNNVLSA
jgi:hypothetical protein